MGGGAEEYQYGWGVASLLTKKHWMFICKFGSRVDSFVNNCNVNLYTFVPGVRTIYKYIYRYTSI